MCVLDGETVRKKERAGTESTEGVRKKQVCCCGPVLDVAGDVTMLRC